MAVGRMIPFGEFLPDLQDYGSHATIARNVIPGASDYRSFPSLAVFSSALDSMCQGAIATKGAGGAPSNFAGDAGKLYLLNSATYNNVSIAGGYTGNAESRWSFTMFGKRVIATNYADNPQHYVLGTSTLFGNLTTAFKSKYVATVRDFVFHGFVNESGVEYPNKIRWSAINDPTGNTIGTNQCDEQEIFGEGEQGNITGIVGGEYATVFMEGGVHRFTYTGGDLIFSRDQIVYGAGCTAPGSIASYGGNIFYLGPDGFYMISGSTVIPIGKNKFDKWFYTDLDQSLSGLISSVIDPINSLYIVAYPGSGNNGTCNRLLVYNWFTQRATFVEPGNIDILVLSMSQNVVSDSTSTDTIYGNPDSGPFANVMLDSRIFVGGKIQLSAIDSNHKLAHFNSIALPATLETAEQQLFPGQKATVTNVTTHISGATSITVEVGKRDSLNETVTYSNASLVNANGEANLFAAARYHRARVTIYGGFDHAYGIDAEARPIGKY